MATLNEALAEIMSIDGATAVALVDGNSGMILGSAGSGMDMEVAAAGNTEVVRSKMKTMKALNLKDEIEDILITLGKQYHVIRPVANKAGLFFYVVLDRTRANLAMARRKVLDVENTLKI